MKNNLLLKILFVFFSVFFISYTLLNLTSEVPYDQTHRRQMNFGETIFWETQIPENSKKYGAASDYLIDPFVMDSTLYFQKSTFLGTKFNSNDWSKIKNHLNYREKNAPKEINIYLGYNNSGDIDELTKDSKVIENDTVHLEERYNFSKSGKLLLHLTFDSIINYYDANDRIKKSGSYKRYSSEETLNQLRDYEYDSFGNLVIYTEFHHNDEKKKYLFQYSTFEYSSSDDKSLDIKKTIFRKEYNKDTYDKEIVYYSFNKEQKLIFKTRIFSISIRNREQEIIEKYFFEYDKKGQLTSIKKEDVTQPQNETAYSWKRDSLNRLILHKEEFNIRQTFYINKDSIVYHSPYERTEYNIKNNNSTLPSADRNGIHRLYFYKEDIYRNTIFIKLVNERAPTNKDGWMYINRNLKYLQNHTWYYMKEVQSYPYPSKELLEDMKENGFLKDDYSIYYREFKSRSSISDKDYKYSDDDETQELKNSFKRNHF